MSGYMVYWPKEYIKELQKAKDNGPIRVVLGSIHTKMPSIASVKVGDILYPVTLEKGNLMVMARLPVEKVESAFEYLLRETGRRHSALIPEGAAVEEDFTPGVFKFYTHTGGVNIYKTADELPPEITRIEYRREEVPHLAHQIPFNCCSQTAASGTQGSTIEPRPIPAEQIPLLLFGPTPAKQKPLRLNGKGELTTVSLAGFTRKMSAETQKIFEALFN